MEESNKKEIIFSLIGILILIASVIGISYAIWIRTYQGEKENVIKSGYISFNYVESDTNIISIDNALPMSDREGKMQQCSNCMFDFSISATYRGVKTIKYDIYATETEQNDLPSEYLKIYLTDQKDQAVPGYDIEVPTYADLINFNSSGDKLLYSSELKTSGEYRNFRLRVWLSSEYNSDKPLTFAFKVNVNSSI